MKASDPQKNLSAEDFARLCLKAKLFPEYEMEALKKVLQTYFVPSHHIRLENRIPVRLCEIGCGFGRLYPTLLMLEGYDVTYSGVDIKNEYLRRFRKDYPEAQIEHFDALQQNFAELKWGTFDVLYLPWTLIHLFPLVTQIDLMSKLAVGLHPGGIMVIDIFLKKEDDAEEGETFADGEFSEEETALIPRIHKEPLKVPFYRGNDLFYEETALVTKLKIGGWIPYCFAGHSPHRYFVLIKP